jgi:phosphohistidine phosphatase SixA
VLPHQSPLHGSNRARTAGLAALAFASVLAPSMSVFSQPNPARPVSAPQLAQLLRAGGYVLVMRHAESPLRRPSVLDAAPDNRRRERQLDAAGKASARVVGAGLRAFDIPIGAIFSSPTFRARETIRFAGLGKPILVPALAEGTRGMSGRAERSRVDWLRAAVRRLPPAGTNTLIVTHTPNIVSAFGRRAVDVEAAEILVFQPSPGHRTRLIGRIDARQWARLVH